MNESMNILNTITIIHPFSPSFPPQKFNMVTTTKGGSTTLTTPTTAECCMCGDFGLSQELFRCKFCKSRFQHKYCSNQYPEAESYKACNWCLNQKHENLGKSTNSSPSGVKHSGDDRRGGAVKNDGNPNEGNASGGIGHVGLKERRKAPEMELKRAGLVRKLQRVSPEEGSPVSGGRKWAGGGVVEEKNHAVLRKSKSANHLSNSGGTKARPVFRNKVRRYKLLEEVSS